MRWSRAAGVNKRDLSEIDICDLFITPSIQQAGWDPVTQIRREVTLTPGPVVVRGNVASRNKKKKKFADYVLYKELGIPIATVEAKDNHHSVGQGLPQALDYAGHPQRPERLQLQWRRLRLLITRPRDRRRISRRSFRCIKFPASRTSSGSGTRFIAASRTQRSL